MQVWPLGGVIGGCQVAPFTLVSNFSRLKAPVARIKKLPPNGATCKSFQFYHQVAPHCYITEDCPIDIISYY